MAVKSLAQSSILQPSTTKSMLAGYESNYFHHLETVRLGGNAASVTFSNLSRYSDYQHLQIRLVGRSSSGSASNYGIRLNGATSGYNSHYISGTGSGINVGSGTGSGITNLIFAQVVPGDANVFAGAIIDILDPFDTSKNKVLRIFNGSARTGTNWLDFSSGLWVSTDALTSIELGITATFAAGSRFSLYGLKAKA